MAFRVFASSTRVPRPRPELIRPVPDPPSSVARLVHHTDTAMALDAYRG